MVTKRKFRMILFSLILKCILSKRNERIQKLKSSDFMTFDEKQQKIIQFNC